MPWKEPYDWDVSVQAGLLAKKTDTRLKAYQLVKPGIRDRGKMSSIHEFSITSLKQAFKKEAATCQSRSSLTSQPMGDSISFRGKKSLEKVTPEELPSEDLKNLKPPKLGRWESLLASLRGTEDQIKYPGNIQLQNFARVDDTVYRGAMPDSGKQFEKLKNAYNVRVIIDLRGAETTKDKYIDFERGWAEHHNIQYVRIPMNSHRPPSQEELKQFFQAIEDAKAAGGSAYVHCKHGIDRTGSMIAAYETKLGRSPQQIYKNMKRYGYNWLHQLSRPAQRDFVNGSDLSARVAAAEAERVKATSNMPRLNGK